MPFKSQSKPIKFRLCIGGIDYSTLEELKCNFPATDILDYIGMLSRWLHQCGHMDMAEDIKNVPVFEIDIKSVIKIIYKEELHFDSLSLVEIALAIYAKYPESGISVLTYFINQNKDLITDLLQNHITSITDKDLSLLYERTSCPELQRFARLDSKTNSPVLSKSKNPFDIRDEIEGRPKNAVFYTQSLSPVQKSEHFNKAVSNLKKQFDINTPIIYINDHDFVRVDDVISAAVKGVVSEEQIIEWNPATKCTTFANKAPAALGGSHPNSTNTEKSPAPYSLSDFLNDYVSTSIPTVLVLKDVHWYLSESCASDDSYPAIISLLHNIAQRKMYYAANKNGKHGYNVTVIIVTSVPITIPKEIFPYTCILDIARPDTDEIERIIDSHLVINNAPLSGDRGKIVSSLKGLTAFEIDRALDMAIGENGNLTDKDTKLLTEQKKQMIKNSGVLELVEATGSIDDIGGLVYLKEYLRKKGRLMMDYKGAEDYGLSMPKGIMLVGMPGCGKSLCAKAASMMFNNIPLLKMDIGNLQGQYVGQSEANMRQAIKMAEAAAPCILWIDEIEKSFSGIGQSNEAYTTRMFGCFLSWMQDKTSQVYIIATANNVDSLPPELKRKGRFDEIFCMDLPTDEERRSIFDTNLVKGKRKCPKLNEYNTQKVSELIKATDGCNGADINAIIDNTLEELFLSNMDKSNKNVFIDKLIDVAKKSVCIKKSCKSQIENMQKAFEANSFIDANTGKLLTKKS